MTIDYAALAGSLNKVFQEPLEDLVARSNPVLMGLQKKAVASDQIYLKGQMASNHNAGPVADGATITPVSPATSYSNATLNWATYTAEFKVNKRVMAQVNNNPGQLGNIFRLEIENAGKDLADRIAADVFGGSVANGLVGLQDVVDDANVYAGIDRAVAGNENWQAAVVDAAAGEISTSLLYQLDEAYFNKNFYGPAERPNLFTGVTSASILTKYRGLLESIDFAALSDAHFVNQANATGNLGIGNTGFLGVPIIRDRNVVAAAGDTANTSRLYMLDMSQIYLAVLDATAGDANIHQIAGFEAAPTTEGIRTQIEVLGNSGEFVAGYVKAYVQLATANPKKAGMVLKNVASV